MDTLADYLITSLANDQNKCLRLLLMRKKQLKQVMQLHLFRLLYNGIVLLGLPFALLRLIWKSRQNPDYRKRLPERFSMTKPPSQKAIWIHTVSVGELLATLPLIKKLLNMQYQLLITTTTPTGSAMLKQRLGERVNHCYLPFDTPLFVHLFLTRTRPQIAIFIETEIWPNYLHQLKKQHIPTLLINARLSEKSFNGYAKLGEFARQTLACFTKVACQNTASQLRFQQLGADAETFGNLKFDLTPPERLVEKQAKLTELFNNKPFILAASTHKGEDEIILTAFQNSVYANSHRLVIAPRHPERSNAILAICQAHHSSAITYTKTSTRLPAKTQTLIIDILGELLYFYSLAEFAIIGGSFIPHGGHNPLEAALFATPCVIGEHYFNFESLVNEMNAEQAIIIASAEQLFTPHQTLSTIGKNAQYFLAKNQGALKRYLRLIQQSLNA